VRAAVEIDNDAVQGMGWHGHHLDLHVACLARI
jgi:hypothetical protein